MEERHILLMILIRVSGGFADKIGPKEGDTNIIRSEGESVTLSCSYDTSSNYVYLYWFRQYPNREPQYLLYKGARSQSSYNNIPDGFQSTASQTSTELTILKAALSDSALYYCALRVGAGGLEYAFSATDPLTFGKPISLTVLPKDVPPTPPTLSIMSPLKGDGKDICLAAGFFPRDKNMILTANGKSPVTQITSNAPFFTSSKTYYYAGFIEDDIEHCQMDEVETNKDLFIPVTEKQIPQHCITNAPSISVSGFKNTDGPKVNSMTLLVTGLRILLAKCVAINVLMTVKAFLF